VTWWRRGAAVTLLASAGVAACTSVSTAPDVPVSLQFDSLPALAVVLGDTMRGADLLPTKIPAQAFDGSGGKVSDSLIRVIGIDTTSVSAFRLVSGRQIQGLKLNTAVRIVAQAGSLQSQTQTFAVIRAPSALVRFAADSVDSLQYARSDTTTRQKDVRVTALISTDTVANGLRVRFRVVNFPAAILDSVRVVGKGSGRNTSSAVIADGSAIVTLKAYPKASAGTQRDSVIVEASLRALGKDVTGSPLRFRVRLVP
jgi:hypothetical protein